MKKPKKDIIINVELDENKIPENIKWSAEDGGVTNQDVKALILSTWDFDKKETLKIDLAFMGWMPSMIISIIISFNK